MFSIDMDPMGRYFATGGVEAIVGIWDMIDCTFVRSIAEKIEDQITGCAFSWDGVYLAISTLSIIQIVKVFYVANNRSRREKSFTQLKREPLESLGILQKLSLRSLAASMSVKNSTRRETALFAMAMQDGIIKRKCGVECLFSNRLK
jgi:predicted acyltransferase